MRVYEMWCIGDYDPFAGTGLNTFRKLKPDYESMLPGDQVMMFHGIGPEEENGILAVEQLSVSSVVIGKLHALLPDHASLHHSIALRGFADPESSLEAHLREFYGDISLDDTFVVIYFNA